MRTLFTLFLTLLLSNVSIADSDSLCKMQTPYNLQFDSFEKKTIDGHISLTLNLTSNSSFIFHDQVRIEDDKKFFSYSISSVPSGKSFIKAGKSKIGIKLNHDKKNLPFYPVKISVFFTHIDSNKVAREFERNCYVYFTSYNTIEIWDVADFYSLKRSWLIGNKTSKDRKFIPKDKIPISDIPVGYIAGDSEEFDMQYIDGLAYAIPMLYPDFPGYFTETEESINDTLSNTLITDPNLIMAARKARKHRHKSHSHHGPCGLLAKKFRGEVNLRLFTWHIPDGPLPKVKIWLKGARVEIWKDNSILDTHLATLFTDDNGNISTTFPPVEV